MQERKKEGVRVFSDFGNIFLTGAGKSAQIHSDQQIGTYFRVFSGYLGRGETPSDGIGLKSVIFGAKFAET